MKKNFTLKLMFSLLFFLTCLSSAAEASEEADFRIMTESEKGDYIGQNSSWDFSDENNSKITVISAKGNYARFSIENFDISNMSFEFKSEEGKSIEPGLYSPAKRYPFQGSYNGISIGGDGRGCNTILGAFYVHEFLLEGDKVLKAAIDFVQTCEPQDSNVFSAKPKLYGSLRYNSNIADSCDSAGCSQAKNNLGYTLLTQSSIPDSLTDSSTENGSNVEIITNPTTEAYKSIVKVMTFTEDSNHKLILDSTGSGVIISSDGLVLTNHHVVTSKNDEFDVEEETSYAICLTSTISNAPDCSYYGTFLASNEELDLALLKINNIPSLSGKTVFDYLDLNQTDTTKVSDKVTAYGYPGIGSDTITITQGIISGKLNQYNSKWIKTDAVISFGSSGGAALDSEDNIIGLTSAAYSDLSATLGYIISVDNITPWFNMNKSNIPAKKKLTDKVIEFIKKSKALENSNTFTSADPDYSITKNADWKFSYKHESEIKILKGSDDKSGMLGITTFAFPFNVSVDKADSFIRRQFSALGLSSMISITKSEDATINGRKARKTKTTLAGSSLNEYYIPVNNIFINISYDYGEDDRDKAAIDSMINSLTITETADKFRENKSFQNSDPKFSLNVDNNWAIMSKNIMTMPASLLYKKNPNIYADIELEKVKDQKTNEEYFENFKQQVKNHNLLTAQVDLSTEIIDSNVHYTVNERLKDVIMIKLITKSASNGDIFTKNIAYIKRLGEKWVTISLNAYNVDDPIFNAAVSDLNLLLNNFSTDGTLALSSGNSLDISRSASKIIIKNQTVYGRLKGKIIIKVEDSGMAYYIHPKSMNAYYLGKPGDAFAVMREQGVGITNKELAKMPIGSLEISGKDTDGDGLADSLEDSIGTDKNKADTDGDGFNDKSELKNGYSPLLKIQKLTYDNAFGAKQKGMIFLQVESKGEAWYINPNDGKRYFLGRPSDAFQVMRNLGLGISNKDYDSMQ